MALAFEQPLCAQSDADLDSSLEAGSDALVQGPTMRAPRMLVPLCFGAAAILALTTFVAATGRSGRSVSPFRLGSAQSAAESAITQAYHFDSEQLHARISYGLRKATCPFVVTDKSDGAQVTLDAIKTFIGAESTDEVEFWWIYPDPSTKGRENETDWTAEEQFSIYGGYMYSWGVQSVCLALIPTGNDLSFAPSVTMPQVKASWHKTAGDTIYEEYAWICPACDASCVHGCFVYKSRVGKASAFRVV